ncbi:hypothetical protein [Paraburkholderia caribensis]|uniref:hypothetical protein n=1 Tax=Paraburkholderia caribensis TaxID=75105 RepID=UPI0012E80E71|nr:hypothetical protein [Paraburkholderia caribensis]
MDVELLHSINVHMEERGSSSSAYVVPIKRIFILSDDTEERCVVVAIPQTLNKDVDVGHKRIYVDVRTTPDRKYRACVMLANGAVALTEAAVAGAAPLQYGRLMIVWMFADEIAASEYPFLDAANEALQRASCLIDTHAHPELRSANLHRGTKRTVIEVFDTFDVDGYITN